LGAFNQWVKGTPLEDWRNRHVDEIGEKLLKETAELLQQRFQSLFGGSCPETWQSPSLSQMQDRKEIAVV
jgi:hypothetical protein